MGYLMKIKLLLFAIILSCMSCLSGAEGIPTQKRNNHFPEFDRNEYKLIHKFYSKDKLPLGNVYAKYITDDIFTSMVITEKENILYFIDEKKFISLDGVDLEINTDSTHRFYGFKTIIMGADYIQLVYLSNEGDNISDYVTIEWNYGKKKFTKMIMP